MVPSRSPRALLGWEIGGGRGHVVHLATVAAALKRRGWRLEAHLVHIDHQAELAPYCEAVHQGPVLPYTRPADGGRRPNSGFGDWLGLHGFWDAGLLTRQIADWRARMMAWQPDMVILEQSPAATLAARSLGLPVVQVGVPTTTPPTSGATYPCFRPDDGRPPLFEEAGMLAAVNEAIAPLGLPALAALPEICRADDQVVASIDLFDAYRAWRDRPRVPPVLGGWSEPGERRSEEVFVYLSTFDRFDPVMLTAIATLDLPCRVVLAGNPEGSAAILAMRKAIVERQPVPPPDIIRRARVLVHAGNHGMSCLGVRAGLPQVTFGYQNEHVYDGSQLAAAGAGILVEKKSWTVPVLKAAIAEAWENSRMAGRAVQLAAETFHEFIGDPGEATADRIEAVRARA